MLVATPGDLQQTLNDAAGTDELVRCENGASFSPSDITVPAAVTLDGRTASFDPGGSPVFSFESGGVIIGGHFDLGANYGGVVFDVNAGSTTMSGPTGPIGSWAGTRQTRQCPATGLRLRAGSGGSLNGVQCHFFTHHVKQAVEVHADGGSITDCDVYGWGTQADGFVYEYGSGELSGNTFYGHNQPHEDEAPSQWHIDAPNAQNEWCQGYMWDPRRMARPWVVHLERGAGDIKFANAQGKTQGQNNKNFNYEDESGSPGNRAIALNELADGKRAELGFPGRQMSTARFFDAVGLTSGSAIGGGLPRTLGVTNETDEAIDVSITVSGRIEENTDESG